MKVKIKEHQTLELITPNPWHLMPISQILMRLKAGDEIEIKKIKKKKVKKK